MAKCELQRGRLSSTTANTTNRESGTKRSTTTAPSAGGSAVSAIRISQARQKKERLSYAIDRLQMQAQQKERQLRKSLAAPPAGVD
jgi:DASH complex subunit SPC19